MRPHPTLLASALTRSAPASTTTPADDAFLQLARTFAPAERAAVSAALRALAQRVEDGALAPAPATPAANHDLFYLPYMAVYPGDDEPA